MITTILGTIGSAIGSFFGFKGEQAKTLQKTLDVVTSVTASESAKDAAVAAIITAEATSGYWLSACWRPLLMVFFACLIGARWFGYMPPGMSEAELLEVYGLLKLGIGGYIGSRGVEKIVSNLNLGSVLKKFIEKKMM